MKRISGLSPRQNLIVGAAVRAVADETMEDALARAIAVRAGRPPDCERLLFAIVDRFEDYELTAPAFILRQAQQVLCGPAVARRSLAPPARAKVDRDFGRWYRRLYGRLAVVTRGIAPCGSGEARYLR